MTMNLFKPRVWSIWEIACIKWSSILFGVIVGIYLADFLKEYVWFLILGCVLLAVKPVVKFFRD
jgi:chromate transport protein ChrA